MILGGGFDDEAAEKAAGLLAMLWVVAAAFLSPATEIYLFRLLAWLIVAVYPVDTTHTSV